MGRTGELRQQICKSRTAGHNNLLRGTRGRCECASLVPRSVMPGNKLERMCVALRKMFGAKSGRAKTLLALPLVPALVYAEVTS